MHEEYVIMRDSIEHNEGRKLIDQTKVKFDEELEEFVINQARLDDERKAKTRLVRRNNIQYSLMSFMILMSFIFIFSFGILKISSKSAEAFVFIALLTLFEFLLVLTDPWVDRITLNVPFYKLMVNTLLAISIFPLHRVFEGLLNKRIKNQNK